MTALAQSISETEDSNSSSSWRLLVKGEWTTEAVLDYSERVSTTYLGPLAGGCENCVMERGRQ